MRPQRPIRLPDAIHQQRGGVFGERFIGVTIRRINHKARAVGDLFNKKTNRGFVVRHPRRHFGKAVNAEEESGEENR